MGASGSVQAICSPIGRGDDVTASPTMRRRRLAAELRRLRHDAGRSIEDVTAGLGWQPSKLSRIENRQVGISTADLRKLFVAYNVADSASATSWLTWPEGPPSAAGGSLSAAMSCPAHSRTSSAWRRRPGRSGHMSRNLYRGCCRPRPTHGRYPDLATELDRFRYRPEGRNPAGPSGRAAPGRGVAEGHCVINEGCCGGWAVPRSCGRRTISTQNRDPANVIIQVLPFNCGEHPAMAGPFRSDLLGPGRPRRGPPREPDDRARPGTARGTPGVRGGVGGDFGQGASPDDSHVMMRTYALRYAGHF